MQRNLQKIYKEDQVDRTMISDWNTISRRDKTRRAEVMKILSTKKRLSSEELYYAAMIFHHSGTITGTKKALTLAKLSMKVGNRGGNSLRGEKKRNGSSLPRLIDFFLWKKNLRNMGRSINEKVYVPLLSSLNMTKKRLTQKEKSLMFHH